MGRGRANGKSGVIISLLLQTSTKGPPVLGSPSDGRIVIKSIVINKYWPKLVIEQVKVLSCDSQEHGCHLL